MTPEQFIAKWQANTRSERAACQEHFIDLCHLLDEPTPNTDPTGATYAFEKGATKATGEDGWADVWRRERFAWEYKGKRKDLDAAHRQLLLYAGALGNPPLLVVSDIARIVIRTNWTNAVSERHDILLPELADPAKRQLLKHVFSDPERLRPGKTREALTAQAAGEFAELAARLRRRGHDPQAVAHFVNRLVFCLFADDVGLLPPGLFERMLAAARKAPARFTDYARRLFRAMAERGGEVDFTPIPWFNGGLFDDDAALPLDAEDIAAVARAAALDWAEIDPSIMGTLFERGLDPEKRGQLGAHYTDRDKIMRLVEPVVLRPLAEEWEQARAEIAALMEKAGAARGPAARARAGREAAARFRAFLDRLRGVRVLDPACGSGNFLYVSLLALKDLEHRAMIEAEALGLQREFPQIGPEAVLGIEVNPYAAELARVSAWIGHIQWARRHGYPPPSDPVLRPLATIACRDALLDPDGAEAAWPEAECILGNPPFLGGKMLRRSLGDAAVDRLFAAYDGRVPREADLVCYWFEKARAAIAAGRARRAGLVATNSIRGGANRRVLDRIAETPGQAIFEAWSDEDWVNEGAAVRVSLLCFGAAPGAPRRLDGRAVQAIGTDLTGGGLDLTRARRLRENANVAFMGDTKGGAFDIPGETARAWLRLPLNPNGRPNADVLRPWVNGLDVTRRPRDMWIVDFGWTMGEAEAALFEAPFAHVEAAVKPERAKNNREAYRRFWWRHVEPRPGMAAAVRKLPRFIATPRVAKHRIFVWLSNPTLPDSRIFVFASDDDTIFGILHSRFHEAWTLRTCQWHGVGNDPQYSLDACFETFPFPDGLTPDRPAAAYAEDPRARAIAAAARRLDELRAQWLNPPDLIRREPEVVPGFPDRLLPRDAAAAKELAKRTLTALYNARPRWLADAHAALDAAVAAAYGWPADIPGEEALARLLALNLARAGT
ncbi:class I SAM-dependent DNA methyltransferase [Crenalkalicoccus roseus]|uniref:class I SAM-dependent DNA methyltransferase n=1 Tax=Crenalkalicoccus roseus TaxID=1485588 RepID=UPI0010819EC0|nr:class I SAM-dependent DNA methyltransferase [Crenalkalicoccus roseus]